MTVYLCILTIKCLFTYEYKTAFYTYRLNNIISVFPSWWMKREASMQSAESAAGLRYLSRWALLQARLLALICGPTMRGSSTHITCSRLETICLYVPSLMFSFPSRVAIAIHVVHCWVAVLLEWFIVHLIAFFKLQSLLLEMYRCRPITTCSKHTLKKCDSEVVYFGLLVSFIFFGCTTSTTLMQSSKHQKSQCSQINISWHSFHKNVLLEGGESYSFVEGSSTITLLLIMIWYYPRCHLFEGQDLLNSPVLCH